MATTSPGTWPNDSRSHPLAMHLLRCAATRRVSVGGHSGILLLHTPDRSILVRREGGRAIALAGPARHGVALALAQQLADETVVIDVRSVA